MEILIIIGKCLLIGIIWAALLIPVLFKKGSVMKYGLTVAVTALLCYFFCFTGRGYAHIINTMTVIALVALVLAYIISMAVFDKESKVKSKVVSFTCVISAFSYLVATLFASDINFL